MIAADDRLKMDFIPKHEVVLGRSSHLWPEHNSLACGAGMAAPPLAREPAGARGRRARRQAFSLRAGRVRIKCEEGGKKLLVAARAASTDTLSADMDNPW